MLFCDTISYRNNFKTQTDGFIYSNTGWTDKTITFNELTEIVGLIQLDNTHPEHCGLYTYTISGNTITFRIYAKIDGSYTVTAIGY